MKEYLIHYGVQGQKWGKRNYQHEDGSLTPEGRVHYGVGDPRNQAKYEKQIRKIEKRAINKRYKEQLKNGGSHIYKPFRVSTGVNYEQVVTDFKEKMKHDTKYRELSKKAFDAEKARLLYEKRYPEWIANGDESRLYSDDKYWKLVNDSEEAGKTKYSYMSKIAESFVEIAKDARIRDMGISEVEDSKIAKQFISDRFHDELFSQDFSYYDNNFEYNEDHFYRPDIETNKFK